MRPNSFATRRRELATEAKGWPAEFRSWIRGLPNWALAGWLAIAAGGIALRIAYLQQPMAYDEAYSFTNFARRPAIEAVADYNNTNNHPLNTLCMHFAWRIFGQKDWALRLPVLAAGSLVVLLAFPWAERRLGAAAGLVTTALVAASPLLVDYSVNARGYSFVLAFALTLDWALLRIRRADEGSPRAATWLVAWLAAVGGFFAVPIMLYPFTGSLLWFAVTGGEGGGGAKRAELVGRLTAAMTLFAATAAGMAALYGPAFVFRGGTASENPFVHPLGASEWAAAFPGAVAAGAERWGIGVIPGASFAVLAVAGMVLVRTEIRDGRSIWPWLAPVVATIALMALQRVAPPPRLFLTLTPWVYGLVGGLVVASGNSGKFTVFSFPSERLRTALALLAIVAAAAAFYPRNPILREPQQRELGIGSVEPAILAVKDGDFGVKGEPVRVLAPLPCDHPAIYYAAKHGLKAEINGMPRNGETVLLLCKRGESAERTLEDVIVKPLAGPVRGATFATVKEFEELRIERAIITARK
jgi:hypothetical protein